MYYLTAAEISDAIDRANPTTDVAGTYTIVGSWVGSARVWMAERITETSGYEVAYDSINHWKAGRVNTDLYGIEPFHRIGAWWDEETGELCLDYTVHIRGARGGVALDVARLYKQKAIWSWHETEVIETTDPATAL